MRVDKLEIPQFKNLHDFQINLDESQLTSVLIGHNGSGKSNLLEALVIIFRDLDLNVPTKEFSYKLQYRCTNHWICVENNAETRRRSFNVDGVKSTQKAFYEKRKEHLPEHLFAYYSGPSNRLEKYFATHQKRFYDALLDGEDEPIRPLFYARTIHSNFVLLAFFSFFNDENMDFLRNYFEIESIESILFVLRKPLWANAKEHSKNSFWGARGIVSNFLKDLYTYATAPIKETVSFTEGIKTVNKEVTYLYLQDQQTMQEFASKYRSNVEFFKCLESMYISDLLEEIRIKIRKIDGTIITFNNLSEGEQQLLMVLGLLKFTQSKESLFLLDEPDTHLNPSWKFEYLNLIEKIVGPSESSQVILSTHDPIVIGGLTKEAVTIFDRSIDGTTVRKPETDPRGMGVAALLTSDIFGCASSVDPETQQQLDRLRQLQYKKDRTEADEIELQKLSDHLENLGFSRTTRDPLYDKFIEKLYSRPEFQNQPITDEERKEMTEIMDDILSELMEEDQ